MKSNVRKSVLWMLKSALRDSVLISENSQDFDKNDEFSQNFEFGAVRKCENLVDLEKSEKMRLLSLS